MLDRFRRWFREPPPARTESRVEFVGEQDGPNERLLKERLGPVLREASHIQRAYLARIGFQPSDSPSVALCLVSSTGDDIDLVKHVDDVFKTIAPRNVFLDVAFLTAKQEEDVARVCSPFYRRE